MSGDNWETQKHLTNEARHMGKSTKGRGQLSTMPVQKLRPALTRVSAAKPNGATERAANINKSK